MCIVFSSLIRAGQCFALNIRTDTVYLKKGQVLVKKGVSIPIQKDTFIIATSSDEYEIIPSKTETFFKKLAESADKRKWTRELHNVIIKSGSTKTDSIRTVSSIEPFVPYTGFRIRNIKVRQLDVFGPTLEDTSRKATSFVERTGNKLHIQSKLFLIRNNLLFKESDLLDPYELADNERILRKLPYIEDARILVIPSKDSTNTADIVVLVKDVWAKAFNIKIDKVFLGSFEMWDKNLLGLGQEIQNNILWNTHEVPSTGYEGNYIVNNIAGSFISGKISYYNSFHKESTGLALERSFFTPDVKYAGGASLFHTNTRVLIKTDTLKFEPLKYNSFDFWAGRSFSLGEDKFKNRHLLSITARIQNDHFLERPLISRNSYYEYQNKVLFLGSVSYSSHNYFKSNFIYNFGRTEDIPVGAEVKATVGQEFNEYANRVYGAFRLSAGRFPDNVGFFYGSFEAGSFFNEKWIKEQAMFNAKLNYFSPLFIVKKFKFRQFLNLNYTDGINRFKNEYLLINEKSGITGFINDSLIGTKRFNIHWETNCFTPWSVYEFQFVLFLFADHSWLTNTGNVFSHDPYTGIGVGLRIRNERLVFNTVQLRFAIYPGIPSGSRANNFMISGEPLLNPTDFLPQAPQVIPFK